MGFMDKAKQMADQAQQKIEETQKQFNDGQAQRSQQPQPGGGGVRYDANGRPIPESAPPAGATSAAPVGPSDQGQPAPAPPQAEGDQPPAQGDPAPSQEQPVESPPVKDGVNAAPDPFKPIE